LSGDDDIEKDSYEKEEVRKAFSLEVGNKVAKNFLSHFLPRPRGGLDVLPDFG
jgi:hypothetical protein